MATSGPVTLDADGLLCSRVFGELSKAFLGNLKLMDSPTVGIPFCKLSHKPCQPVRLVFHNINVWIILSIVFYGDFSFFLT